MRDKVFEEITPKRYYDRGGYRNQTVTSKAPSQQYMNQIGRVRMLEDQLMGGKFKIDALERKGFQYIDIIQSCQKQILNLQEELSRANQQIHLNMLKDAQIENYQVNLGEIGIQISSLNEALLKKNSDCTRLFEINKKYQQENQELRKILKQMNQRQNYVKSTTQKLLKLFEAENDISFGGSVIENDLKLLEQNIINLNHKFLKVKSQLQKNRKQGSESNIQQKQEIIKLQYTLKLAENRSTDLEKKKSIENSFAIDKTTQKIIQEMLQKQDTLIGELEKLQNQNEQLKESLQQEIQSRNHYEALKNSELQSQLQSAKKHIHQLINEKSKIQERLQEVSSYSEFYTSRSANQDAEFSKKYRQAQQEAKRLQVKVLDLTSDKQMLEKQLRLRYKQNYQQFDQES